jgi:hypothetical protein
MTDKGSQFMNDTLKRFAQISGIAHLTSIPYSKEENGIVERQNKEVNRHIRNILFDVQIIDSWSDFLIMTEKILNSSVKQPLGVSPNTLLFANSIDVDVGLLTELDRTADITPPRSIRDYVDTLMSNQHKLIAAAIASQTKLNDEHLSKRYVGYKRRPPPRPCSTRRGDDPNIHIAHVATLVVANTTKNNTMDTVRPLQVYNWNWDGIETEPNQPRGYTKSLSQTQDIVPHVTELDMTNFILTTYHVGDFVLRKHAPSKIGSGPPDKYGAWWRGPFVITHVFHDTHKAIYTIRDLVTYKQYEADVCQLKPFYYDPNYVYPLNVAIKGSGEFLVDHIVTHDFSDPHKPLWQVRWAGFDDIWNHSRSSRTLNNSTPTASSTSNLNSSLRDVFPSGKGVVRMNMEKIILRVLTKRSRYEDA